jgi:hypothetical protein
MTLLDLLGEQFWTDRASQLDYYGKNSLIRTDRAIQYTNKWVYFD